MRLNYTAHPRSRGFTLIELLVVIAIIGILASIILASLSTARNKAADVKIEEQLNSMREQAELYTGAGTAVAAVTPCPTSGTNLFADPTAGVSSLAPEFVGITNANTRCASATGDPRTGTQWAVAVLLNNGGVWCVDYTGVSRNATATSTAYTTLLSAIGASATSCS